jgi:heme exporter protein B
LSNKILLLLRLELLREWRNKYALAGLLVYELSCILVVKFMVQYSGAKNISAESAIALFWLILLFSAVNAIANALHQEPEGRKYYYMWLAAPTDVITAKLIYNFLLSIFLTLVAFVTFGVLVGFQLSDYLLFVTTAIAGSCGYAFVFTTVGAVASGSKNNASLLAILGMPLVIPLLIFISKLSVASIETAASEQAIQNLFLLLAFDVIIAALALVSFPYLWRD